jgi:hypothetical protein
VNNPRRTVVVALAVLLLMGFVAGGLASVADTDEQDKARLGGDQPPDSDERA